MAGGGSLSGALPAKAPVVAITNPVAGVPLTHCPCTHTCGLGPSGHEPPARPKCKRTPWMLAARQGAFVGRAACAENSPAIGHRSKQQSSVPRRWHLSSAPPPKPTRESRNCASPGMPDRPIWPIGKSARNCQIAMQHQGRESTPWGKVHRIRRGARHRPPCEGSPRAAPSNRPARERGNPSPENGIASAS